MARTCKINWRKIVKCGSFCALFILGLCSSNAEITQALRPSCPFDGTVFDPVPELGGFYKISNHASTSEELNGACERCLLGRFPQVYEPKETMAGAEPPKISVCLEKMRNCLEELRENKHFVIFSEELKRNVACKQIFEEALKPLKISIQKELPGFWKKMQNKIERCRQQIARPSVKKYFSQTRQQQEFYECLWDN